ncbi:MAG: hypothetical protein KF767_17810 [Bdellovibrionaceae bacterium]|mgnify:CR=1 FL=1|nr:hypothetical protein [Pseudobdellovibrionaceae bacterium]
MRRLFALVAGIALLGLVGFNVAASGAAETAPATAKSYQLDFEFQRHGQSVCKSQLIAQAGNWYVVCGLNASQNPITQIRLHTTPLTESPGQNHIRAVYEEIDAVTGEVKTISNAMVATLDGETSSISQGVYDENGEVVTVLSFEVKITPL